MNSDGTNQRNISPSNYLDFAQNWPPDGKYILFYSNRTGNEEIWRINKDGSNSINLTNHSANERSAAYSIDGKKIAFISDRINGNTELFIMNKNGKEVKQLTNNGEYCESPVFTKDGKHIIFTTMAKPDSSSKNTDGELFILNLISLETKRLTYKTGFDSGAAISPDGKTVAFYGKSVLGFMDIFTMNIDGTNIQNLTNDSIEDYSPSWSPDGNWLAFTSGNSSNYDIWKIHVKTKEKIQLTSLPTRDEQPYFYPIKNK
jgi:TolB protein